MVPLDNNLLINKAKYFLTYNSSLGLKASDIIFFIYSCSAKNLELYFLFPILLITSTAANLNKISSVTTYYIHLSKIYLL